MAEPDQGWINTGLLLYAGFEQYEAGVLAFLHGAGHAEIRRTHFNVIRHLNAPGARMSDLAVRANLTKAAITGLVRECEDMGLVTVAGDPSDGRARIVRFTEKGTELKRYLTSTRMLLEQQIRECLGGEAYESLRQSLTKLSAMEKMVPRDVAAIGGSRRTA